MIDLDYGDLIRYEHPEFGTGSGAIVGKTDVKNEYYVRPRAKLNPKFYPDGCFICHISQLMLTPF